MKLVNQNTSGVWEQMKKQIMLHDPTDEKDKNMFVGIYYSHFIPEWRGSGERHRERYRRGVYTSSGTVCAAQMGVDFGQSSGTVPV